MAAEWYRKSIALTKKLAPLYGAGARHWLAIRDEALAEVLGRKDQAPEQLRLLLEANLAAANWRKPVHMAGFT